MIKLIKNKGLNTFININLFIISILNKELLLILNSVFLMIINKIYYLILSITTSILNGV